MFWGLLAVITIAYAMPVFSTDYPLGIDPTFHCILIQKILNNGILATNLYPFEEIVVNYSQGMHVFLAVLAKLSGQAPHLVFQVMHMPLLVAYSAGIYLMAVRIFRNATIGFWSMLIFSFVVNNGGFFFSIYQWGGMPTEMSGLLGLGFLLCVLGMRCRTEHIYAVLICGAMLLTHHLTILIYFLSIAFYLIVSFMAQRKLTWLAQRFIMTGIGTLLVYSWFIIPYALKASCLEGTAVLKFYEEPLITIEMLTNGFGYAVIVLAVVGLILKLKSRFHGERERFLLGLFSGLLLFFCLLDDVYRAAAIVFCNENFTAFTPSRFLTFLVCPMVIFAGLALKVFVTEITKRVPNFFARAVAPAIFLLAVAYAVPKIVSNSSTRAIRPEVIRYAQIIRDGTPTNAFIFDKLQLKLNERCWLSYLTWRQMLLSPILASENRKKVYEKKLLYLENNLEYPDKIKEWMDKRGLECYMFTINRQGDGQLIKLLGRR